MNQLLESFATLIKLFAEPLVCSCLLFLTVAQALLWIAFARHSDRTHERLRTLEYEAAERAVDDVCKTFFEGSTSPRFRAVEAARQCAERKQLQPSEVAAASEFLGE